MRGNELREHCAVSKSAALKSSIRRPRTPAERRSASPLPRLRVVGGSRAGERSPEKVRVRRERQEARPTVAKRATTAPRERASAGNAAPTTRLAVVRPPQARSGAAPTPTRPEAVLRTSGTQQRQAARHPLAACITGGARQAMLVAMDCDDFGIAELEALGLSLRVINLLEEKLGIIWLRELLSYDPSELRERVPFLGQSGVEEIIGALSRFDQLAAYEARLAAHLKPGPLPPR